MTATTFPYDAVRHWCAICLQHRVEHIGDYTCPVCEPRPITPLADLLLPAPAQPWLDNFQAAWAGLP